ncbi:hypothetical protein GS496_17145 [Rhodococcus hoagii]|nr:hypothetical protein [Prescottella equi]NKV21532.1 hypothetical protein [Prescottella equi]
MTRDQIITLLQTVAAYDGRKVDQLVVAAWSEAAVRANWNPGEAVEAVHEHYSKSHAWLMPGHVTELIRSGKRVPAPASEVLSLNAAPPASADRRAEVMAEIRRIADRKSVGNG